MSRFIHRLSLCTASIMLPLIFGLQLYFASPYAHSWDEVDFVLAVERYDLLAMQPHFPGYPYFIAGAKLIHIWVSDPLHSLTIWNAVLALSSAVPIMLLARRYIGLHAALWTAVCVQTLPYLWLMGARPMSECAGIAALWWYLWSIRRAADRPESNVRLGIALAMFSVLMGIRLSYFPFGLGLALLLAFQYRSHPDSRAGLRRLILAAVSACTMQLIWIGGLIMSEGTLQGFWKLSIAFVYGHFSEWGGGVTESGMPLGTRLVTLIAGHLIRDVWLSRSAAMAVLYGALLLVTAWGIWRRSGSREKIHADKSFHSWLWLCLGAYAIWVFLGQNIEKPRHIAPVAGPLLLMLFILALRTAQISVSSAGGSRGGRYAAAGIRLAVAGVLTVQLITGVQLLKLQAGQKPAVYQLHEYMATIKEPFVLYTWEETRVLQYLKAGYEHRKILTYNYFQSLAQARTGQRIFMTDHVWESFKQQQPDARAKVVPVAEFVSEELFDPVYSRITLYEWIRPDQPAGTR